MKIKIGISSCPNDTFAFDAIFNKRILVDDLEFDFVIADIEELNHMLSNDDVDVCKVSFANIAKFLHRYCILNSGNALGYGQGPLLIANKQYSFDELNDLNIAIPGKNTTANFLMNLFFPYAQNKTEFLFSEIEEVILSKKIQAGVIIHEGRFTFHEKALIKLCDLGQLWEQKTSLPIPLGCIVANRKLPFEILQKVENFIKQSIIFAKQNPLISKDFVKKNAQSMNDLIIQKHIDLYVSEFSVDLGTIGKEAIQRFFKEFAQMNSINHSDELFLQQI